MPKKRNNKPDLAPPDAVKPKNLKHIVYNSMFKSIFDNAEPHKLYRIDNLKGMPRDLNYTVILPFMKSLVDLDPSDEVIDFSWVRISYVFSLQVLCGYVFELPHADITLRPDMLRFDASKLDINCKNLIKSVNQQFSNNHFSIFNASDVAMLILVKPI